MTHMPPQSSSYSFTSPDLHALPAAAAAAAGWMPYSQFAYPSKAIILT